MNTYKIPMIPGPVRVPEKVFEAYRFNYGSADLETEFIALYRKTSNNLQKIMGTESSIAIQSGEGMLSPWSALKSCILPGDRVLSIATGLFGDGIGDIPGSGLQIRDAFAGHDARRRLAIDPAPAPEPKGCACGEVLTGAKTPPECPLYRTVCTPTDPVGPCMVSSEGTCAAYYRYHRDP